VATAAQAAMVARTATAEATEHPVAILAWVAPAATPEALRAALPAARPTPPHPTPARERLLEDPWAQARRQLALDSCHPATVWTPCQPIRTPLKRAATWSFVALRSRGSYG
jgi:hypothetical protein